MSLPRFTPLAALLAFVALDAPARAQSPQSASPTMRAQAAELMQVCRGDYERLCAGVRPGGGRILACLQANAPSLSPSCAGAMPRAAELRERAAARGVLPQ